MADFTVTVTIKKTIRYHIASRIALISVFFGIAAPAEWLLKDMENNPRRYVKIKR